VSLGKALNRLPPPLSGLTGRNRGQLNSKSEKVTLLSPSQGTEINGYLNLHSNFLCCFRLSKPYQPQTERERQLSLLSAFDCDSESENSIKEAEEGCETSRNESNKEHSMAEQSADCEMDAAEKNCDESQMDIANDFSEELCSDKYNLNVTEEFCENKIIKSIKENIAEELPADHDNAKESENSKDFLINVDTKTLSHEVLTQSKPKNSVVAENFFETSPPSETTNDILKEDTSSVSVMENNANEDENSNHNAADLRK